MKADKDVYIYSTVFWRQFMQNRSITPDCSTYSRVHKMQTSLVSPNAHTIGLEV
jgi:hypothetical protein